jgi:hypothetical protein
MRHGEQVRATAITFGADLAGGRRAQLGRKLPVAAEPLALHERINVKGTT